MELKQGTTLLKLPVIRFSDKDGAACSLQKSTAEGAIFFGCDDADPRRLVGNTGKWLPVHFPPDTIFNTSMHLTRDQVAALIPVLQKFVDTGEVSVS